MSADLSLGVIGLGFGANHARVLGELPGVRLVAVCDADESRLATVAKGRDVHTYTNYKTMLEQEKLDAVVVAVPASLHETVALAAIEAGCAVLVEKPLGISLEQGHRIEAAAREAGVALVPGHIERFNPAVQELKRRVQAGEIGRVLHITARRMGPMVANTRDVNVVYDSALHDIDVMRYVVGAEVERVYAEGRSDLLLPFEDGISALLRFESGTTATLDVNWLAARRIRDLSVRGEKGFLTLDYTAQTLELFEYGGTLPIGSRGWSPTGEGTREGGRLLPVEPREPLLQELTALRDTLKVRTPFPVSIADALAALSVCDALTQSARTGLPVTPEAI